LFSQNFNKLKVLNLSNCKCLTTLPDFSQSSQLEILILEGCTSLVQVHESIRYLKRLVSLNLKNCTNLKDLPRCIFNLESLETLDLSGCLELEKFPEQLPSSFGVLKNLKTLSLYGCSRLSKLPNFLQVPHLKSLVLEGCTSLVEIHESIELLKGLVLLDLQRCESLRNLPSSISNLEALETLDLCGCLALEKLPEQLPSSFGLLKNLKIVSLRECSRLTKLPNLQSPHLERLILEGCTSLVEIHESIGLLKRLVLLNLQSCKNLRNLPSSISNLKSLETLDLWKCYNLEKLPEQLGNMTALKELDVGLTAIKQVPSSFRLLTNLESLRFFGCVCLIESPEFSETSCLKELSFEGCTSLVEIHESIGHLKRLKSLNFGRCKKLRNLPISSICNLESLKAVMLSVCIELDKLPKQLENMKALWKLTADGVRIGSRGPKSSLHLLSTLSVLTLHGCGGPISSKTSDRMSLLSISKLCSLTELDLSDRNLSEDEFPESECLYSLKRLNLSRNNFRNLPNCISCLPKLQHLDLNECTTLQSISLPRSVIVLGANGCTSLERISILTNQSSGSFDLDNLDILDKISSSFYLENCYKLVDIQNLESLRCVPTTVRMGSCNNLSSDFRESVLQVLSLLSFSLSLSFSFYDAN
jgi:Leucine-rich repeat (LRR) protein